MNERAENPRLERRFDMRSTVALILAGGVGSRLNVLVKRRAKPAVPFGGIYRIIDFTLSNAMNSGIERVGILTQYMPYSLAKHLGRGESWGLVGRSREARILPPHTGTSEADWYQGTADAIYRNLDYLARYDPEIALILSGDHIYHMDYDALIAYHIQMGAEATIAVKEVPIAEAHLFGTVMTDRDDWITGFEEKPEKPRSNLISLGIYAFNTEVLTQELEEKCGLLRHTDFGKHIFPGMLERGKVAAYRFGGYWQDVGTLKAYFDTTMELLEPGSPLDLPNWNVRTNMGTEGSGDQPPAYIAPGARVRHATLARGCRIHGSVEDSVLSPGVFVAEGARVSNSILMHETRVEAGASVEHVIADKRVVVERGARLGDAHLGDANNQAFPEHFGNGITVVGKEAHIPSGGRIGRNCCIFPGADLGRLEVGTLASGETIRWERRARERGGER